MSGQMPWSADVPISMPEPNTGKSLVQMFGFVFTVDGLFHDITEADHERLSRPTFAPVQVAQTVFDDGAVS